MADTTEFTGTQQTQQGTGLIPQAGQFLSNVQQMANQPSVQRSLPAVIAVVVLALGLFVYSLLQQPERTTLYASLPDSEKSKVQDALKNMGVDVSLDPTTGEILVPVEDYHRSRISLAAQGLPSSAPDGYSTLTDLPMGSSRSVELMRLKQTQEIELEKCNQYTIQGDLFSLSILNDKKVPTPIEDAVANMKVLEAVIQSADKEKWCLPES